MVLHQAVLLVLLYLDTLVILMTISKEPLSNKRGFSLRCSADGFDRVRVAALPTLLHPKPYQGLAPQAVASVRVFRCRPVWSLRCACQHIHVELRIAFCSLQP